MSDAPLSQTGRLRERVSRYAAERWLCVRCGKPLEYHREGFECRPRAWWRTEPGFLTKQNGT
jgi:hypothetical protein